MKNVKNLANGTSGTGESASRTGRDVGRVGQVRLRGLWRERIGERRVNDIIFCSFAFYS